MQLRKESLIFSGFLFATAQVALITARIFFTLISSFRSSNIRISYIHNFTKESLPFLSSLLLKISKPEFTAGHDTGLPQELQLLPPHLMSCVQLQLLKDLGHVFYAPFWPC